MAPLIGSWPSIDINRFTCRLYALRIAYMTQDKRFISGLLPLFTGVWPILVKLKRLSKKFFLDKCPLMGFKCPPAPKDGFASRPKGAGFLSFHRLSMFPIAMKGRRRVPAYLNVSGGILKGVGKGISSSVSWRTELDKALFRPIEFRGKCRNACVRIPGGNSPDPTERRIEEALGLRPCKPAMPSLYGASLGYPVGEAVKMSWM